MWARLAESPAQVKPSATLCSHGETWLGKNPRPSLFEWLQNLFLPFPCNYMTESFLLAVCWRPPWVLETPAVTYSNNNYLLCQTSNKGLSPVS